MTPTPLKTDTQVDRVATWKQMQLTRYRDLGRQEVQGWARQVRKETLKSVRERKDSKAYHLPYAADELVQYLSVERPEEALVKSMQLTDNALQRARDTANTKVELAGLYSALAERELWEIPTDEGLVTENVALARRLGTYFTPPAVAWYITVETIAPKLQHIYRNGDRGDLQSLKELVVLDPGCGSGIFLVCALQLLLSFWDLVNQGREGTPHPLGPRNEFAKHIAREQLYGVDVSGRSIELAKRMITETTGVERTDLDGLVVGNALTGQAHGRATDVADQFREGKYGTAVNWDECLPEGRADFVLLNPPYGRLRVLKSDFRQKSRALDLSEQEANDLFQERKEYLNELKRFFRSDPVYKSALGGVLDWQRLFLVRSLSLLSDSGRLGAIVPVSVAADRSSKAFRRVLFDESNLERLVRLPESAALFPTVNQPTCILVTEKDGSTAEFITTAPTDELPPESSDEFRVTRREIEAVSSNDLAIPSTDPEGWTIIDKLHAEGRIGNDPRIVNARGEFDLSIHKDFLGEGDQPLIRGDHVERYRFSHTPNGEKEASVAGAAFRKRIEGSSKVDHINRPRLVGRQCAYLEKPRRLSFVVVEPGYVVANSCNYLLWDAEGEVTGLYFLCGILNSAVAEWRFRLTSSNNHVNNYEIDQIPLPASSHITAIAERARRLRKAYREGGRRRRRKAEIEGLEVELDAEICAAYGLQDRHVERVLRDLTPERTQAVLDRLAERNG